MSQTQAKSPSEYETSIVELRQYTLHPGKRDVLIDIFEREFLDAQESVGIEVIGQFRDLANQDRFVWLRGFRDMVARPQGLEAFYASATWKTFRDEVNAILVDYSNVLLLRPAWSGSGFSYLDRRSLDANHASKDLITATICSLGSVPIADFIEYFNCIFKPTLEKVGGLCLAVFTTEPSANNYPRLPVREGENLFVWFTRFVSQDMHDYVASAPTNTLSLSQLQNNLRARLNGPPEILNLSPTPRSKIH